MSQNKPQASLPSYMGTVWLVYTIASSFNTTVTGAYLMFFVTEYAGVSSALMVSVISVARIFDLVVSLFSGAIINRSSRFYPWVFACPLITWIGVSITFLNLNIDMLPKMIILVAGYCMTHFPMNFLTVAVNGFMMKQTGANPETRLMIASRRNQGMSAARILLSAMTLPMVNLFQGMGMNGYFVTVFIFGIVTMAGTIILIMAGRQYEPKVEKTAVKSAAPQASVVQMFLSAAKNRSIMTLLLTEILTMGAMQVIASGATYYYRYSCNNLDYMTVAGTVSGVVALGTSIIAPIIARRMGKRNSRILMYVWVGICYTICIFTIHGNALLYIIMSSVLSLGTSVSATWGINLYLDAAEIELYQTGVDKRPFIMSINNIPIKLGFLASGPFIGIMLEAAKYNGVEQTMADPATYVRYWVGIPAVAYAAALLIFLIGYRVNDSEAKEAAAANAKAAQERAAAASAN